MTATWCLEVTNLSCLGLSFIPWQDEQHLVPSVSGFSPTHHTGTSAPKHAISASVTPGTDCMYAGTSISYNIIRLAISYQITPLNSASTSQILRSSLNNHASSERIRSNLTSLDNHKKTRKAIKIALKFAYFGGPESGIICFQVGRQSERLEHSLLIHKNL